MPPVAKNLAAPKTYTLELRPEVRAAIAQASARSGVDFSYLVAKAAQESGFDTAARARTSSASGLYQFIETTWLDMVRRHGAKYGLGELAGRIETDHDGRPRVADAALRKRILELRKDPRLSAAMAAELARENRDALERSGIRQIGKTELYLAHFLGAGGAARFLGALRDNAKVPAADLFPEAAQANRGVFYDRKTGEALSLRRIYDRFAAKMKNAAPAAPPPLPQPKPLLAPLMTAEALPTLAAPSATGRPDEPAAAEKPKARPLVASRAPVWGRPQLAVAPESVIALNALLALPTVPHAASAPARRAG
jgi:hypothetical protein